MHLSGVEPMQYGAWTCYTMRECYITKLSETLCCKVPWTHKAPGYGSASLAGIILILLLTC